MVDQFFVIGDFIVTAFVHIWPYLLITIPLAVAVNMSGAARHINRAFDARPLLAIFLATAVGAFSPFCSCGVIPVIAALLMSGVPLAPVMSFWIASPSMDPEAFFLSVSAIGWDLAVGRLVATLILSLGAGFVTHFVVGQGWLGQDLLRHQRTTSVQSTRTLLQRGWQKVKLGVRRMSLLRLSVEEPILAVEVACCNPPVSSNMNWKGGEQLTSTAAVSISSCDTGCSTRADSSVRSMKGGSCSDKPTSLGGRLLGEIWNATLMVTKFMALAFFLEALIALYIPDEWIAGLLGRQNPWAIPTAAFLGVPVYTSNLAALPMVSGLLAQGMNPAAALAFLVQNQGTFSGIKQLPWDSELFPNFSSEGALVAGPTTTLPAMAAVWGLTTRRVFALYVSFSLVGAVVLGYLYSLVM